MPDGVNATRETQPLEISAVPSRGLAPGV